MNKKLACALVAIGLLTLMNTILLIRRTEDHAPTTGDVKLPQNNLWPTGQMHRIGTRMTATRERPYPETAEQGGTSVVTNTTGRWAG